MLVVNPNNRIPGPYSAIEPPLWAGLIASHYKADILDAEAMNLSLDDTVQAIKESRHTDVVIVVMGNNPSVSSTPKMEIAGKLADRLYGLDVALTGIHPLATVGQHPYSTLHNPFEGFPMQPWDKLPMSLYRAHAWHCLDGSPRSPYASIYTSLGCPFDCYYCNIHTLYGDRQVRYRPIEDIIKEVDILTGKYKVRNIKIWDELFALNENRVLEICCDAFLLSDVNIWAYARLDTITEPMLHFMSLTGFKWLAYGFENVKDPKFISRAEDVICMTREAGINIIANFMFGLPGTTVEDDIASVEFAKKHLFEFVNFYDAKPYPGSQWYRDIQASQNWQDYNQYGKVSDFRKKALIEYFSNPAYLKKIQDKWGNQAVETVKGMNEWLYAPVR